MARRDPYPLRVRPIRALPTTAAFNAVDAYDQRTAEYRNALDWFTTTSAEWDANDEKKRQDQAREMIEGERRTLARRQRARQRSKNLVRIRSLDEEIADIEQTITGLEDRARGLVPDALPVPATRVADDWPHEEEERRSFWAAHRETVSHGQITVLHMYDSVRRCVLEVRLPGAEFALQAEAGVWLDELLKRHTEWERSHLELVRG